VHTLSSIILTYIFNIQGKVIILSNSVYPQFEHDYFPSKFQFPPKNNTTPSTASSRYCTLSLTRHNSKKSCSIATHRQSTMPPPQTPAAPAQQPKEIRKSPQTLKREALERSKARYKQAEIEYAAAEKGAAAKKKLNARGTGTKRKRANGGNAANSSRQVSRAKRVQERARKMGSSICLMMMTMMVSEEWMTMVTMMTTQLTIKLMRTLTGSTTLLTRPKSTTETKMTHHIITMTKTRKFRFGIGTFNAAC
jgi:hypothetical protein